MVVEAQGSVVDWWAGIGDCVVDDWEIDSRWEMGDG